MKDSLIHATVLGKLVNPLSAYFSPVLFCVGSVWWALFSASLLFISLSLALALPLPLFFVLVILGWIGSQWLLLNEWVNGYRAPVSVGRCDFVTPLGERYRWLILVVVVVVVVAAVVGLVDSRSGTCVLHEMSRLQIVSCVPLALQYKILLPTCRRQKEVTGPLACPCK